MNISDLQKRTVQLLEKTKKNVEKYGEQRKKLDKYLREDSNELEWEKFLLEFEQKIKEEE